MIFAFIVFIAMLHIGVSFLICSSAYGLPMLVAYGNHNFRHYFGKGKKIFGKSTIIEDIF
jgi:hypothetical protein